MQSRGTVDHTPVYPREDVKRALELSASAIILVHNHRSGEPTPGRADIDMTNEIVKAAQALGVRVHDHLVIGHRSQASFKGLGLLWGETIAICLSVPCFETHLRTGGDVH